MAINSGMYNRPMTEEEKKLMMIQGLKQNQNAPQVTNAATSIGPADARSYFVPSSESGEMPENYNIDSSNYSTMIQQIRDKELADMGLSYMELDKIYEEYGYDTLEAKEAIKRLQVIKGLKMDDTMSIMGR